jgi:hypothetical protein
VVLDVVTSVSEEHIVSIVYHKDEDDMFSQIFGNDTQTYMSSHHRRSQPSFIIMLSEARY